MTRPVEVTHRRTPDDPAQMRFRDGRLDTLADWGRRLAELGVSPEASGNLSCRSADGFFITRTSVPLGVIEPDDWVEVTAVTPRPDGGLEVTSRGDHEPSRDAAVHAAIYDHHPAATAVFHLHPDYLDTLSDAMSIPATEHHRQAGTVESVREIEGFLADHPDTRYFVLVEHGIVAWGATIEEAGEAVEAHHGVAVGLRR